MFGKNGGVEIFGALGAVMEVNYKVYQGTYIFIISLIVEWFKYSSNVIFTLGLKP